MNCDTQVQPTGAALPRPGAEPTDQQGVIFDIQRYCLYDGPGIRTCVFFKGCPLSCSWCHNPESQDHKPEQSYDPRRCRHCERCRGDACLHGARERIGRIATVADIVAAVVADQPFFEASGGGATLTGGEPTAQPEFALALLAALGGAGIHTALETCGLFPSRLVPRLAAVTDVVLFDLKHMDPGRHLVGTGVPNERILQRFGELLTALGTERIVPRIPVLPGFNADAASMGACADFLVSRGYAGPVHLMPVHDMARDKYRRLGRPSPTLAAGTSLPTHERQRIAGLFESRSLSPVWGGE